DRPHVQQVTEPDRGVVRRVVVRRRPPAFEMADEARAARAQLRHLTLRRTACTLPRRRAAGCSTTNASPLSSAFECPNLARGLSTLDRGMEAILENRLRSRCERCGVTIIRRPGGSSVRVLKVTQPPTQGADVRMLQKLLG